MLTLLTTTFQCSFSVQGPGLTDIEPILSILFKSHFSEPLNIKPKALFNSSQTVNKLDNSHEVGKLDGKQILSPG